MSESIYYKNRHLLQQSFAANFFAVMGLSHEQVSVPMLQSVKATPQIPEQERAEDVLRAGRIFEDRQVPKPWRTAMAHVAGILTVRHALTADELREQTNLPQALFDTATAMLTGPLPQRYALGYNPEQTMVIAPSEENNRYQSSGLLEVLAENAEEHFPSFYSTIELYSRIAINGNS